MNEIKVFKHATAEYAQALALRYEVLRRPLGLQFTPQELKKDEEDIHLGLFTGTQILACLTLTPHPGGQIKMRQVAVAENQQGKGLGKQLCAAAEKYALENGFSTVFCNARKTAAPFYKNMGYQVKGNEFMEVGIPHYYMEKQLK